MKKLALASAFVLAMATTGHAETHYLAIHVNENDPGVMNLALNNAQNVASYYSAKGDEVMIEVVTYGPGLNMLIDGKSPVADRIETMALELQGQISFAACGNTHRKMSEAAGADIALIAEAAMVPSGVIRLMELQEDGYSYLKP